MRRSASSLGDELSPPRSSEASGVAGIRDASKRCWKETVKIAVKMFEHSGLFIVRHYFVNGKSVLKWIFVIFILALCLLIFNNTQSSDFNSTV